MRFWTMKEVTRLTGATESALRYYNKKGVVTPTVREESGRRQWLYDDAAIETLKRLALLKYIGIPVTKIPEALENEQTCRELIQSRLEQLEQDKANLEIRIFVARILAVSGGSELLSGEDPDPVSKILEETIRDHIRTLGEERK